MLDGVSWWGCRFRVLGLLGAAGLAGIVACGDDGGDAALQRLIESDAAFEPAFCACEACGNDDPDRHACLVGVLQPHAAELEDSLRCRAGWLETVTRCLEAVLECDLEERRSCAAPLTRLDALCEPWPAPLQSELAACGGGGQGCFADDGCMPGARSFRCEDGLEIPAERVCDGRHDCADAGDEAGCDAAGPTFLCDDGERIALSFRCDFTAHCADGSDEQGCDALSFECDDGASIPRAWRCDTEPDCADGSDERGCDRFVCDDGSELPAAWRCDGVEDCPGGDDELSC